jgi:preprotein translocase subunit SecG
MLYSVLIIIDVLLAIAIIAFILLQQGKGANAGAAFGSGASATVFGSRGSASFLSRTTAILATLFFVNSLGLAHLAKHRPVAHSVVEKLGEEHASSPEGQNLPPKDAQPPSAPVPAPKAPQTDLPQ